MTPAIIRSVKPEGGTCPKCSGFYIWDGVNHGCVNCGYCYNPPIEVREVVREHCTWGKCHKKIWADRSRIYCREHYLATLKRARELKGRPDKGLPAPNRSNRYDIRNDDLKARHSWPIPIGGSKRSRSQIPRLELDP